MAAGHIGGLLVRYPLPAVRGAGRWIITLAATVASTYALDAVATAAGLALAASQLLSGLERAWVVAFLVASYVAWGAGLWTNLKANWDLLLRTGTSTNVLSKVAHDLVARL